MRLLTVGSRQSRVGGKGKDARGDSLPAADSRLSATPSSVQRVLIVGATSAIGGAVARRFASEGARLFLVARDTAHLAIVANDLTARGAAQTETFALDLNEIARHGDMLAAADAALGGLDTTLIAYGTLSDQAACEASVEATLQEWQTNATSTIALLTLLANDFAQRRAGTIAVVTSVAGDRGRKSNYVYGAAKGALNIFVAGLRGRLAAVGVAVITIEPGFVDTPMTAHLPKNALFATPDKVGTDIHRAILRGTDVVYTPFFWRYIMLILKLVPERIFKRLSI